MELAKSYPTAVVCRVLAVPRSSFYAKRARQARLPKAHDQHLKAQLEALAAAWPCYGYRRMTEHLRREGHRVGRKRVRRLMGEMGLGGRKPVRKIRTTDSEHGFRRWPNLVMDLQITRPDQVWVSDITYIRLDREFVYLAVIMDVYTRSIRGWYLGRNLDGQLTLWALDQALSGHRCEIHHSDQGVQYAATAYIERLNDVKARISMASVGQAWQNGYAERLMRTIKEEEVDLSDYEDLADARAQIGYFLESVYQHKRIHSSLGYLTPSEFEAAYFKEQSEVEHPR